MALPMKLVPLFGLRFQIEPMRRFETKTGESLIGFDKKARTLIMEVKFLGDLG